MSESENVQKLLEYKSTRIQEYKNTRIQECKNARIQEYQNRILQARSQVVTFSRSGHLVRPPSYDPPSPIA